MENRQSPKWPIDVPWIICSENCPLSKVEGLTTEVVSGRICDDFDRSHCNNIARKITEYLEILETESPDVTDQT